MFPKLYIDFLKLYSRGLTTFRGKRELQFFSLEELVQTNIDYGIFKWLKGAVSIAMDGSGNHLIFDMRKGVNENIYGISSGDLDWQEIKWIANDLHELFMGTVAIDELLI